MVDLVAASGSGGIDSASMTIDGRELTPTSSGCQTNGCATQLTAQVSPVDNGAACITVKLAAEARAGTLLELNFDDRQQRDYIDFDKDLFNATAVFGPAGIASVTSSPRRMWSSAGQRTLTIGFSVGALARPGTLRITVGAIDAREPLLTPEVSLSDETSVLLAHHH